MGDIRNKIAKIEGLRREKAALAFATREYARLAVREKPSIHGQQPDRCVCGHDYKQAHLIAVDSGEWPRRIEMFCPACIPERYREDMRRALALNMLGPIPPEA